MAFEQRNGNSYYYRKIRIRDRVISEYVGKGLFALIASEQDKITRQSKINLAEKEKEFIGKFRQADETLAELEKEIKKLTENVLISLGFYKTKSREWRIKHNGNRIKTQRNKNI